MERRGEGGIGRRRDNAYDGKEEFLHLTREQKEEKYDTLYESIKVNGFNEEFPILIMLRRENNADMLFEGHHRLNISIELGLETVPVRFIEWEKEYNAKGRWVNK
jgi:ParB-like chromosome segregation protein Spo0J